MKQWRQIAVAILSLQGAACCKTFSLAKSESCRNARGQCGVFTRFRCDVVANQCLSLWVSGWMSSMVLSPSKCRCLASVHTDGTMPILCFWRDFLWVYDRHYKAVGANNTVLHNGQWCIFRVSVVVVAKVLWVVARVRKSEKQVFVILIPRYSLCSSFSASCCHFNMFREKIWLLRKLIAYLFSTNHIIWGVIHLRGTNFVWFEV